MMVIKIITIVLLAFVFCPTIKAELVHFAQFDIEYPPLQWRKKKKLLGVDVDLVKETFNRSPSFELELVPLPIARTFQYHSAGLIDVTHTYNNEVTQGYSLYSRLPIRYAVYQLIVRKGEGFEYKSLEDLRGKRIATLKVVSLGGEMNSAVDRGILRISRISSHQQLLEMLQRSRVDAVFMHIDVARYYANKLGFEIEILDPGPKFIRGFYLAVSTRADISDPAKLTEELSQALESMYRDGTQAKIMARYGLHAHRPETE